MRRIRPPGRRSLHPRSIELGPLILLIGLFVAAAALLARFPASSGYADLGERGFGTITINRERGTMYLTTLGTGVLAAAYALWYAHRWGRGGWVAAVVGLATPAAFFNGAFDDMTSYGDEASVRDRDGAEYHLFAMSFLQGSELAIGRLRRRGLFLEEYLVVVTAPWEASFGYLGVVRPQGPSGERRLAITP